MNTNQTTANKKLQAVIQLIENSGSFDKKYYTYQLKNAGKKQRTLLNTISWKAVKPAWSRILAL
ncbi:hypothetical protein [Pseudomonas syringae]|uniref:hypothetical protein n=1 Tax=Pseudomonas syringae TaxID=317 RepID=UPI00051748B9|nr:hypothetical protein [Pseudomonas syringae]